MIKENVVKNLVVIIVAGLFCSTMQSVLGGIGADAVGDLLMIISILLVTVCFANFAFTYEKVDPLFWGQRWLAHLATGCFLLLTALLLLAMIVAVQSVYPTLSWLIIVFCILLYAGVVLYDFWDVLRMRRGD